MRAGRRLRHVGRAHRHEGCPRSGAEEEPAGTQADPARHAEALRPWHRFHRIGVVAIVEWVIYASWQVDSRAPAAETSNAFPDWSTARRQALHLTCCRGARYVTVCGPDSVVVADWDRYTRLWREYILNIRSCDGEAETS